MSFSREIKIGLIGIVALVLLFFTIKFLQGISLFTQHDSYYIVFSDAKGLAKSSPVYADGYNVGIVSNVRYDYSRPGHGVVVEISVEHGMRIPAGTMAVLDQAMLGGCTLNLQMGNSPVERFSTGDTIPSAANKGLMARAAELMPQLEITLAKVDTLLTTLNALASNPNIQQILANVNTMTASLDQSSKNLNHLLEKDLPAMTLTFNQAGENVVQLTNTLNQLDLRATMDKVDNTMAGVQQMTERLNSKDNNVGLLLNDTALYGNLNRTTTSAAMLLEDLKAHPKRYVHFSVFGKKEKNTGE